MYAALTVHNIYAQYIFCEIRHAGDGPPATLDQPRRRLYSCSAASAAQASPSYRFHPNPIARRVIIPP